MSGSDVVAALSVIAAGIVAPILAMVTARWQVARHGSDQDLAERRRLLDEAATELARLLRSVAQRQATWRDGRFDDEPEDLIRVRLAAQEGVFTLHSRVVIGFGLQSEVARTYAEVQPLVENVNLVFRVLRRREPLSPEHEERLAAAYKSLRVARDRFLDAAHQATA